MTSVRRLNHAVLYVRDGRRAADFYKEAFGFEVVADYGDGQAVFLRAAGTENHHDLGLFSIGAQAPPPQPGRVGLYHLAWQVDTIHDLADMRSRLQAMGALVGESDHGVTKSLYGKDPDGNEFEVMWMVPREQWGAMEHEAITQRLDLASELAKHG
ncbi:MAG TPA: VOC family protein [Acidimicrobiia bacterium]|jgi:catechol-2,3-dioxygenase|nr:VOC family protein [Acidimicrobiia bacterium]